jgi:hypothetical protein
MHGYYPHDYVEENFYTKEEVQNLLEKFKDVMVEYVKLQSIGKDQRTDSQVLNNFLCENVYKG